MTDERTPEQPVQPIAIIMPPAKASVGVVQRILPLAPTTMDEAYRCAKAFVLAGMAPESYVIKPNSAGKEVKPWEDGHIDVKPQRPAS